jgi:hypothetical protein
MPGTSHITYTYNYTGNNVQFRNETDSLLIEATSAALVRSTYSRAFPEEPTISGIQGDMHVGVHPAYEVKHEEENIIDVHPEDIVTTYTYEVRGVTGTQFIRGVRGGISGFSASYFLATGRLAATPSTVLFDGVSNSTNGTLTGSFRTFGRLDNTTNVFTIEILYPSQTAGGGIMQKSWNVTGQIDNGGTHILIDNAGIDIPDEGGEEAGGWNVDLDEWNDVTVPLG